MNKRKYVIFILLCMTTWLQAQDSVKTFDEFFVTGMKKIEGVFPVYVAEKEVYLEIPGEYIGREIEVRGQIAVSYTHLDVYKRQLLPPVVGKRKLLPGLSWMKIYSREVRCLSTIAWIVLIQNLSAIGD